MCSDPDLMQAWKRKLQVSKLKKNCSGRDTTRVGEQGFVGCWGCSADKLQLVDAPILTHYGLADKKKVPRHDAFNDESLTVQPPTGKRSGGDDTLRDESVFGCYYNRKNLCRKHDVISRVLANAIDTLATRLTVWVETLDKMVVARKDTFIACHDKTLDGGPLPAPPPRDRIVLLADVVGNPKMQYYHPCCVDGESSWCVAWPLRVPLRMSLASGAPRMGGAWQVVQTMTSDELCCALAKASPPDNRQFLSLDAQYLRNGPSLLTFEVLAVGREIANAYRPRGRVHLSEIPELLQSGSDPLADGAREVAAARGSSAGLGPLQAVPRRHTRGEDALAPIAHLDWPEASFGEEEQELLGAVDPILREDVAEGVDDEELCGISDASLDGLNGCDERDEDVGDADLVGWDAEPPSGEHAIGHDASSGGVGVPAPPLEVARASVVRADGYVLCPMQPWSSFGRPVGRITTWPDSRPMERRNVSVRCYMHPGCKRAFLRASVSDELLLQWLFSCWPLAAGSSESDREAARQLHYAQWHTLG